MADRALNGSFKHPSFAPSVRRVPEEGSKRQSERKRAPKASQCHWQLDAFCLASWLCGSGDSLAVGCVTGERREAEERATGLRDECRRLKKDPGSLAKICGFRYDYIVFYIHMGHICNSMYVFVISESQAVA